MAGKQYNFDFVLNAVVNGGFSAAFTKAQQEFVRLGNEIKNLQAIQRDITSYQKQQQAVGNTDKKLQNLTKQYELIDRQIKEAQGSTAGLEREKLKLEQRIDTTAAALQKQNGRLDELKGRLDAAGVSADNLGGRYDQLTREIEELTAEQKKTAEGALEFKSTGMEVMESVAGAIAAAGIAEKVGAIKDAFVECVTVAADFEQAMSAVEAIAGATSGEMAALTDEAKRLGAETVFTAQQSANAMEYMAMAGWDASEMLGGMSGVMSLAAASGEDLAMVSDIVTDNLSAFGLRASDTAHFADVLAAAAANSNTNVAIMGETFKSSSSVAGALGYSIEDVAVMVGLMANNAVKGSRAGTALRNIFNGLLEGVSLSAEAFGDMEYSAVNSDGSMKGLMETVRDLRWYFDQMTESEQVNNAMTLAGMRGYNGLLAILNATEEDFQNLYASIENCTGAAEKMAAVKMDNLKGDLELMSGAYDALTNTFGEQFTPELRKASQAGTELLNNVDGIIQENPALVKGLTAGAGAFIAMGTAVVGVNAAVTAFKALNLAALFASAGPWLAAAGGIAAVAAVGIGVSDALRNGVGAVRELTGAAREMNAVMDEAETTYEDTAASAMATAEVANLYIDKLEEMGDAARLSGEEQERYQDTLALLLQVMPSLSDCISQTTDQYGRATYTLNTTTDALRANAEEWKKNAEAQAYQEYLNTLMEQYNSVMVEAVENRIGLTEAEYQYEEAVRKREEAQARIAELMEQANAEAERQYREFGILAPATSYLTQEYYDLTASIAGLNEEIDRAQGDMDAHQKAMEKDGEAIAEAEEKITWAQKAVRKFLEALGLYTEEEEDAAAAGGTLQTVLADTTSRVEELTTAYREAYAEALESFSGQFGLFDEAKADAEATVEAAQTALNTQFNYWEEYAENIAALREMSADDLRLTQENYNALMSFVSQGTPEAAGLAADMVKKLNSGDIEALTKLGETWGKIIEQQEFVAQYTADWAVGLTEQMDTLIAGIQEDIGALDLSAEAGENARETIQSYIDKATDPSTLAAVRAAYARVAAVAAGGLGMSTMVYNSGAGFAIRGATGFAGGTADAPPGWAWVGEYGPELMRMHGGEQILPASVSRKAAEDYSRYSKYAPQGVQRTRPPLEVTGGGQGGHGGGKVDMHFHIEAGASPETVDAWQDYARRGELEAVVLGVLERADADARRRTLA